MAMSVPYNNDTRETYVARQKEGHLHLAEVFSEFESCERSMWLQLIYYAMSEDVYGAHWRKLESKRSKH